MNCQTGEPKQLFINSMESCVCDCFFVVSFHWCSHSFSDARGVSRWMNGLDGSLWNWMSVGILRAISDHQLNGVNHQVLSLGINDLDFGWAQKWKQEKYGKRSCIFGLHKTQQWSSTFSLLCHTSSNVPFSASVSIFRFHNSGWFLCFAQCLGIASTALGNASVPVLADGDFF